MKEVWARFDCPSCGAVVMGHILACPKCGGRLPRMPVEAVAEASPEPQPAGPEPAGPGPSAPPKFCTDCGTPLAPGKKFCTACGRAVSSSSAS